METLTEIIKNKYGVFSSHTHKQYGIHFTLVYNLIVNSKRE